MPRQIRFFTEALDGDGVLVEHLVEVEAAFNQAPFVDAPEALHDQRSGFHTQRRFGGGRILGPDREREASDVPTHRFVQELGGLATERTPHLLFGDHAELHQQLAQ